ncbi:membrane progestin receptor gamma-B-like, partial [Engraulis encrasicolus]|uniref:membrane progestin receptor gamma-B-like n=1 Tax=Engraulis encrasicolus TaxID=184585 RepID=UPI002FD08AF6
YFLWKLLAVMLMQEEGGWREAYTWPLLVFLLSCCVYPLASSCAHTFSTMSTSARHICFFFDYGAISFYSLGSAVTYSAYVMPDNWVNGTFHKYFVSIAVFNAVVATAMSCYSRLGLPFLHYNHDTIKRFPESQSPRFGQLVRILSFALPYLFDNIPLFYRLFLCSGEGCTTNAANALHYRHIGLAFLTAFLCATHLPERLAPGRFDFIGHSHQLFHVSGIIGTLIQMQAIEVDMRERRHWLAENSGPVTLSATFGAAGLCITLSLLIILIFSLSLLLCPARTTQRAQKGKARD